MTQNIYNDIAERTHGDIYIGVVGPVRTGKSTFIKRFMDTLVLPNMDDEHAKSRAQDELPQSAAGKTVMTTEPKFIPNEAVTLHLGDNAAFRVKMIDCVGYIVPGAMGLTEEGKPRMVMTPWAAEPMPFEKAAEIGTKKVINEHSTIGILVTTDIRQEPLVRRTGPYVEKGSWRPRGYRRAALQRHQQDRAALLQGLLRLRRTGCGVHREERRLLLLPHPLLHRV